jgi:hypothetical protein
MATGRLIPKLVGFFMQAVTMVVKLDAYEAEAVKRIVNLIRQKKGRRIAPEQFVATCVRYVVHDLMPGDFMLGPDAKELLKDVRS